MKHQWWTSNSWILLHWFTYIFSEDSLILNHDSSSKVFWSSISIKLFLMMTFGFWRLFLYICLFILNFYILLLKLSIFTFLAPNVTKISRNTHLCRSMLECMTSVNPINVIILDVHRLSAKSQTWYDTNEFIQERSHLDARCAESSSLPARISSSMFRYTIQTANAWITSAYLKDVAKLIYTRPAWRSIMWRVIITSTSRYSRSKRVS